MRKVVFVAFVIICTLSACIRQPSYPIIPAITFVLVSSDIVRVGSSDSVIFSFTDGDGDIGPLSSNGDTGNICGLEHGDSSILHNPNFNIFLIDNRDSCVSLLASANVEPTGKYKAISGQIIVFPTIYSKSRDSNCFSLPNPACPFDTVIFTILLRDKAGHFSNAIKTTPIVCDPH